MINQAPVRKECGKGFTLIETMIYLALFVVIIGGTLLVTYQIITASTEAQEQALVYEEANFLMDKINWALLSGNKKICQPTVGSSGTNLFLYSDCSSLADPILFTLSGNDLTIKVGSGGSTEVLNNDSLKVEPVGGVIFAHVAGNPPALQTTYRVIDKLTGKTQDVSTIKYLRQ